MGDNAHTFYFANKNQTNDISSEESSFCEFAELYIRENGVESDSTVMRPNAKENDSGLDERLEDGNKAKALLNASAVHAEGLNDNVTANRIKFEDYYPKCREYEGVIEDISFDRGVFSATFREPFSKEEYSAEFELSVFSSDEVDNLFVGSEFVLLVGQKRKLFQKPNGDIGETGSENFSKFLFKPLYRFSVKESKEINERVKRWSELLAI